MSDMQPEAGFSNSEPVEDAPQDVHPDVDPPEEPAPGFSNAKAVTNDDAAPEDTAPDASGDDNATPATQPAKKTAKKSAAKKKG